MRDVELPYFEYVMPDGMDNLEKEFHAVSFWVAGSDGLVPAAREASTVQLLPP